jgi:hypothetical protein
MSQHPTRGVAGSKPRLLKIEGNGRPSNKAEMQRLSREYLALRNRQMEAKAFLAETEAQLRRGELLDKERIQRQLADIIVALRQSILNFSPRYASRMVGLPDEHTARQILAEASREFLVELSELPAKISCPNTGGPRMKVNLFDRQTPRQSGPRRRRRRFVARRRLRRCASFALRGGPKTSEPPQSPIVANDCNELRTRIAARGFRNGRVDLTHTKINLASFCPLARIRGPNG